MSINGSIYTLTRAPRGSQLAFDTILEDGKAIGRVIEDGKAIVAYLIAHPNDPCREYCKAFRQHAEAVAWIVQCTEAEADSLYDEAERLEAA